MCWHNCANQVEMKPQTHVRLYNDPKIQPRQDYSVDTSLGIYTFTAFMVHDVSPWNVVSNKPILFHRYMVNFGIYEEIDH